MFRPESRRLISFAPADVRALPTVGFTTTTNGSAVIGTDYTPTNCRCHV